MLNNDQNYTLALITPFLYPRNFNGQFVFIYFVFEIGHRNTWKPLFYLSHKNMKIKKGTNCTNGAISGVQQSFYFVPVNLSCRFWMCFSSYNIKLIYYIRICALNNNKSTPNCIQSHYGFIFGLCTLDCKQWGLSQAIFSTSKQSLCGATQMPTIPLAAAFNSIQQNNQHPKIMSINTALVDLMRLHFICILRLRRCIRRQLVCAWVHFHFGLFQNVRFSPISLECKQIDFIDRIFSTPCTRPNNCWCHEDFVNMSRLFAQRITKWMKRYASCSMLIDSWWWRPIFIHTNWASCAPNIHACAHINASDGVKTA